MILREPSVVDRPRPDGTDIRKVDAATVRPVARSLAEAFYDDPHFRWMVRDDDRRMGVLERSIALFARRIWLPRGESYTHEELIGGAMWMPPGTWRVSVFAQLRLTPGLIRSMGADVWRLLKAFTYIERHHPHEPHWYLAMVGVARAWQGRGYGSALMRPVLERCDREGMPAYLEASTPRNLALYERNGFRVVEECRYAEDGPPLWRMWREPEV